MSNRIEEFRRDEKQRGMTLVEMSIATVLILAIVGLTHSSTIAVHSATQYSEKRLSQESSSRNVLNTLRKELAEATLEKDPKTNLYRYSIDTGKSGKQQLTFQKLVSAAMVDGEVEAVWSTNIMIGSNSDNQVTRTQDGKSRILGTNVKNMYFETTLSGKFKVTVVTLRPDKKNGKVMEVHNTVYIKASN